MALESVKLFEQSPLSSLLTRVKQWTHSSMSAAWRCCRMGGTTRDRCTMAWARTQLMISAAQRTAVAVTSLLTLSPLSTGHTACSTCTPNTDTLHLTYLMQHLRTATQTRHQMGSSAVVRALASRVRVNEPLSWRRC